MKCVRPGSSRRTGGEGHSSAARRSNARAVSVRGDEMRAAACRRRAIQLLPGPGAVAGMLPERRRWGTATRGGGRGQAPHPGLGAGSLEPECYVRNKARQARVRRGRGQARAPARPRSTDSCRRPAAARPRSPRTAPGWGSPPRYRGPPTARPAPRGG